MKPSTFVGFALGVLATLALVSFLVSYNTQERVEVDQAGYEVLPDSDKARVESLKSDLIPAAFLIFKDGKILEISKVRLNTFRGAEIDSQAAHSDYVRRVALTNWALHRDVDRVVKETDPDWCSVARKYLSQK